MKIQKTKVDFTKGIDSGRFAFYIYVDSNGLEIDNKELVIQAQHFPVIVLIGDEAFKQKEELADFVKKVKKINDDILIRIETFGTIIPIGLGDMENVKIIVNLQLKNSGLTYEKRINSKAINWFNIAKAIFIFNILEKDDMDEASLLINSLEIEKSRVYFNCNTSFFYNEMISLCKYYGFNYIVQ